MVASGRDGEQLGGGRRGEAKRGKASWGGVGREEKGRKERRGVRSSGAMHAVWAGLEFDRGGGVRVRVLGRGRAGVPSV